MKNTKQLLQYVPAILAATAAIALAGCNGGFEQGANRPVTIPGTALQGNVHGGQQPVVGAQVSLYAASTTGYSAATANVLTAAVTTDTGGNFNITGDYPCTAGQMVYIVAVGGDPGSGTNPNSALMAALGDCASLNAGNFISVNEVTTVASAYALAPFMSDITHVGSSSTNTQGLVRAFNNVNKLTNIATGSASGPALATGAIFPTAELNTLANVLAACINSTGGTGGDTTCGKLFNYVTPTGGTAPTDTIGLALALAHNPSLNVASVFDQVMPTSPFQPQLPSAPSDWTLSVSYKTGGLNAPASTAVDSSGNIWVANAGNSTVSVLSQAGSPLSGSPFSGNGLNAPSAVAIDSAGNAWIANAGSSSVSAFTSAGATVPGSPFSGNGTISAPSSVAIDAPGNIWIANTGNKTVTELNSAGSFIYQSSAQTTGPTSIAINPR
jgi:hypothetical protein